MDADRGTLIAAGRWMDGRQLDDLLITKSIEWSIGDDWFHRIGA